MLSEENYTERAYFFRDRQAGVSVIFDPESDCFSYNAYCLELVLQKELYTVEFEFLADALDLINDEFGTWEIRDLAPQSSGCGSCVAKK